MWDFKDESVEETQVDEFEKRSIDSGHNSFQVLAITAKFEIGELGQDSLS